MVVPKFVFEFTNNHMGNFNLLMRMLGKAAWAGCDYVKMTKKNVWTFYSKEELEAPNTYILPYGKTYGEYRSTFEFDKEDFDRFDRKCRGYKIPWYMTIQDVMALEFMLPYDLPAYKVASANARDRSFMKLLADNIPRDKTIVISVGGSTLPEIEEALAIFGNHKLIYVQHCVAEYPCHAEHLRLGNIPVLIDKFGSDQVRIGYSGHDEGIEAPLAAVDLGAQIIEKHFIVKRHTLFPRTECALEPEEYKQLIDTVKSGESLSRYYKLPDKAFESHFGMSNFEREFLADQSYARKQFRGR